MVGEGETSDVGNNALIITNPDIPTDVTNDALTTSSTTIKMTWVAPVFIGGSTVIDYRITYKLKDAGDETYADLVDGVTNTYYDTTALVSGSEYTFKVEARNAFGYSLTTSTPLTILQAQIPDTPTTLANNVAVTAAGIVGLTWVDGSFNGASNIIDYTVLYDQGLGDGVSWIDLATGVATASHTATGL